MHRKQLVTLGSAVGILACGACFLPPPRPAPPRPRPHLNLHGSNRIRVTVTNSGTQAIDTAMLERCLVGSINHRRPAGVPAAVGGGNAQNNDAVLQVTVENETATPEPQRSSRDVSTWDVKVTLSATLAQAGGTWYGRRPTSSLTDSFSRPPELHPGPRNGLVRGRTITSATRSQSACCPAEDNLV
ncbi:MAG TPA: hypothetical protein VKB38_12515 [Terracidiphilus sp.]|nr:hypothetical protein [Terracidiphilus sp.]